MAGLTATGFDKPSMAETEAAIRADLLARLGPSINLLPTSLFGAIVTIMAERYDELWQAALDLYNGMDPATAEGVLLGYLGALQGIFPLAATTSTVSLTVDPDAAITLTVGRLVSDPTTGVQFITTEAVTSVGAGTYPVAAESTVTGPVAASAGSLTQIDTPVSGWNTVTNALDAEAGTDAETDAEFRLRRLEALAAPGSTTPDAIRADTAAIDTTKVEGVFLLENRSDVTDGNGLPPHSFEVIIDDVDDPLADDVIAQAIWDDSKAAGIATFGSDSGTAVDLESNNQTVNFTHVTGLTGWVEVDYLTDSSYPAGGDQAVKDAIAAFELDAGQTLYASKINDLVFNVQGVVNITDVQVGLVNPPVGTSVTATVRERIRLDSTRVIVNVT